MKAGTTKPVYFTSWVARICEFNMIGVMKDSGLGIRMDFEKVSLRN